MYFHQENEESKEGTNYNTPNTKEENLEEIYNYKSQNLKNIELINKKIKNAKVFLEISSRIGILNCFYNQL